MCDTEEEAIAAWNTRALDRPAPGEALTDEQWDEIKTRWHWSNSPEASKLNREILVGVLMRRAPAPAPEGYKQHIEAEIEAQLALKKWPTKYDELMCDPVFRAAYAKEFAITDRDELKARMERLTETNIITKEAVKIAVETRCSTAGAMAEATHRRTLYHIAARAAKEANRGRSESRRGNALSDSSSRYAVRSGVARRRENT